VSEQAILNRLDAGDLVGLKKGREWRLPLWQFNAQTTRGFLPGLAELQAAFTGGVVSLTEWATTENADLDRQTPARALAAGDPAKVITVALHATAAAW
jgi:hypothetical protein